MTVVIWTALIVAILALVALDLGVFHRRPHEMSVPEALAWSALWILAALTFTVLVHWLYGGLLLVSAARLLMARDDTLATEEHIIVRATRQWIPVTRDFHGTRFSGHGERGARGHSPALGSGDGGDERCRLRDRLDSAIFAVTDQPFIVYTSNVFAVLGLRSLYFSLAPLLDRLRYLKTSRHVARLPSARDTLEPARSGCGTLRVPTAAMEGGGCPRRRRDARDRRRRRPALTGPWALSSGASPRA